MTPPPQAARAEEAVEGGPLSEEEVLACSFERWYSTFREHTFRSRILPLSEEAVRYLQADGVRVPRARPRRGAAAEEAGSEGSSDWGDGGSDSDDEDGVDPSFPELEADIERAISDLGGAVLPKLNWSAPKDARWISGTGLKCDCVQEIFTLLKSSDFVAHDLAHSFDHCGAAQPAQASQAQGVEARRTRPDAFNLVLREWRRVDEAGEFRCFVRGGRLRAISQRHSSIFFEHLVDAEFTGTVVESIVAFFEEYAFDVLVGKPPRRKVRLIDFSPWSPSTDPLMYDWDELEALGGDQGNNNSDVNGLPEFRAVQSETDRRAKLENYHCLPLEVAQMGNHTPDEMAELCRKAEAHLRPTSG